ncbi:MAG: GLPGLI family protein [Prevotellaceae bacterium]|nr:GLPGLI family protein [Prevotellaceae bacterium]
MKRLYFFLILNIVCCSITPRSSSAQIALGTATLRCKYEMSYKEDITGNNYKNDLIYLDIGRESSHCYSFYTRYRDSIQNALLDQGWGGMEVGAQTSDIRRGVRYFMAKQYKTQTLFASDILISSYMYTEPIPSIDWQITQDTATIRSYPCRKATAQFRGRTWIAWFTTEIPLSEGPWQFGGLSGLILHLEDTQQHYIISCIGIEQLAPPITMQFQTMRRDGPYKKVLREQLSRLQREFYADVNEFLRNYSAIISTSLSSRPRPYNPIELE